MPATQGRRKRQATNTDVIKADYSIALNTAPAVVGAPSLDTAEVTQYVVDIVADMETEPNITIGGQQAIVQDVGAPVVTIGSSHKYNIVTKVVQGCGHTKKTWQNMHF